MSLIDLAAHVDPVVADGIIDFIAEDVELGGHRIVIAWDIDRGIVDRGHAPRTGREARFGGRSRDPEATANDEPECNYHDDDAKACHGRGVLRCSWIATGVPH
jgi:hypothetical protein